MGGYRMVDLLVHLDAEDIGIVYEWRKQQEREMGQGMTEDQVERFVDACGFFWVLEEEGGSRADADRYAGL